MNAKKWERFFEYLHEITEMPQMTHEEKKAEVLRQAKELGGEMDLEEFVAWFDGHGF